MTGSPNTPPAVDRPRLEDHIQDLRARDNITNFIYIGRVFAIIVTTIAGTVWFYSARDGLGLSWWWNVPVTLLAMTILGASQHQLGGAGHEATHFSLFRNRLLNELASDWLCMFPLYTTTHQFRIHHLAHHQFVNDPVRDPDQSQLRDSGHWLDFPISHMTFLWLLLRQLWIPNLIRYTLTRARYSALGDYDSTYRDHRRQASRWPIRVGIIYAIATPLLLGQIARVGSAGLLAASMIVLAAAAVCYYAFVPESSLPGDRIPPVISHRTTWISRIVFLTLMYGSITWIDFTTTQPAGLYFLLLWIAPLFTTFPLFMILRQVVQHGNADRGRLTNTRVFRVNPLIRYAVFPFGMDFHLPHHLYAAIPHYNLARLHTLLLTDAEYARRGVVVHGYALPAQGRDRHPTILDVLGPEHVPAAEDVYIDDRALEETALDSGTGDSVRR